MPLLNLYAMNPLEYLWSHDPRYLEQHQSPPLTLSDYWNNQGLAGLITYLWDSYNGTLQAREANNTIPASQSEAQDFERQERLATQDWEIQTHLDQLENDPSRQMQGLENAGISRAAAAQAVLGQSTSWSPSATNNSTPTLTAQMGNAAALPELIKSMIEKPAIDARARKDNAEADSIPTTSNSVVARNNAEANLFSRKTREIGQRLKLDKKNLEVTQFLANISAYKTVADVNKMTEEINAIHQQINESFARIMEIDSQIDLNNSMSRLNYVRALRERRQTIYDRQKASDESALAQSQTQQNKSEAAKRDAETYLLNIDGQIKSILGTNNIPSSLWETIYQAGIYMPAQALDQAVEGWRFGRRHKVVRDPNSIKGNYFGRGSYFRGFWNPIQSKKDKTTKLRYKN